MKKWKWILLAGLTLLSLAAGFIGSHGHGEGHWWDHLPGFFILFGFLGCAGLILFAKTLGKKILFRDEEYYDDK